MNKNWPNDPLIGCKPFSTLVSLIEVDAKLKEKLKEFQGTFEKDEILEYSLLLKVLCNIFIIIYTSLFLLFNYSF